MNFSNIVFVSVDRMVHVLHVSIASANVEDEFLHLFGFLILTDILMQL